MLPVSSLHSRSFLQTCSRVLSSSPLAAAAAILSVLILFLLFARWCNSNSKLAPNKQQADPKSSKSKPMPQHPPRPTSSFSNMFSVVVQRPLPFTPFTFGSIRPHPDAAPLPSIESVPVVEPEPLYTPSHQPFDALLVLDVEATCQEGTDFQWPNEIIEFPVCLLKWTDKGNTGKASKLEIVDEFRSFVKPTWRPNLTQFCTNLTGITQEQVDAAPHFPEVADMFTAFLMKHGLLHPQTGERIARFCWCTDGPFDVRDFVVKQCFISNIPMPYWIRGDVMDVRKAVGILSELPQIQTKKPLFPRRISLNISSQLRTLGLPPFEGRQHSGIDDSRNIARIVIELARRGICLQPNTFIHPGRRWAWMGKHGQILEEYCMN